ncbi:drug resistance transporter, Bcr/CflA subfamily protein [Neorickettsia helminthoeca str. Oregon]|uniref:Bcr/CflA family efflux transporter n=1 Tax=Neorickettsia helminthoeca str. Oregon TaxID=1286528 RepID=X5H306_9RICK|nr:multidrug effflux MFS transporter [Neorickettsia helminthoeca]AHX11043.1 drug resistance transporter, Bcr/CflA subfamily protein [Neorickettsia helminthoeca str. Oregon]
MNYLLHTTLITLVVLVADIAVEIYVPALPSIAAFFSASAEIIKLTMGSNILGIAVSSLFYGALSDAWGRKPALILGLSIFVVASLLCIFSTSVFVLIFWRFFQGVGQGVAMVVGFASVKDFYSGERCAQIISRLSTVVAVSPAFAPLLGSMILVHFTWHYIFLFLALIASICLLMLIFFFQDTLKHKNPLSLRAIFASYMRVIRNKNYILYSFVVVITFMWLWNVITSAPFLLLEDMNVPMTEYGYLVAINVSGFVIGTILNHRYLHYVGLRNFIRFGLTLPLLSEILLIILHYTTGFSALLLECIWFFSAMGLAFVIGNATTLVLDQVDERDNGKATALLVFFEMVFGALGVYINAPFYDGTIVPLAIFTIGCVLATMLMLLILFRVDRKENTTNQVVR